MLNETIAVYLQDIRKEIMTVSPCLNVKNTYPQVRGLVILASLPTLYSHTELFAFFFFYLHHVILVNVKSDVSSE